MIDYSTLLVVFKNPKFDLGCRFKMSKIDFVLAFDSSCFIQVFQKVLVEFPNIYSLNI